MPVPGGMRYTPLPGRIPRSLARNRRVSFHGGKCLTPLFVNYMESSLKIGKPFKKSPANC